MAELFSSSPPRAQCSELEDADVAEERRLEAEHLPAPPLAFFMFPHPAFQCVCAYAFGRFIYQIGYTYGGFLFHLPGFFLDRFATFTMLSLLSIAYFQ